MDLIIKKIIDKKEKEIISKEVLYDLPEWFGLPESTEVICTQNSGHIYI